MGKPAAMPFEWARLMTSLSWVLMLETKQHPLYWIEPGSLSEEDGQA